jgi:hypothetical protein
MYGGDFIKQIHLATIMPDHVQDAGDSVASKTSQVSILFR